MIAAMLEACGYKVGLYTRPHLVDIRERMQINGQMISREDLRGSSGSCRADRRQDEADAHVLRRASRPSPSSTSPSRRSTSPWSRPAWAAGWTPPTCIKPEVTAITSISKDHMAQLGNTLAKIAEEKAGIFKPGIPAVTVLQEPGVEAVFKRVAEKVGCPLDIAGKTSSSAIASSPPGCWARTTASA